MDYESLGAAVISPLPDLQSRNLNISSMIIFLIHNYIYFVHKYALSF